ncbi:MAG TPA: antibiotic biosynthesis monooxygenase [Thermomicrobiales bacterium]|nr:antibiotic biosynthesis monooxygenase [Thermomicrobiales bacterium]
MYTIVQRRRIDPARQQETRERAQRDFFPQLQRAPGFVGFYLVADEEQGITTAITVWQDQASAAAFQPQVDAFTQVLKSMGARRESINRGETVVAITPQR